MAAPRQALADTPQEVEKTLAELRQQLYSTRASFKVKNNVESWAKDLLNNERSVGQAPDSIEEEEEEKEEKNQSAVFSSKSASIFDLAALRRPSMFVKEGPEVQFKAIAKAMKDQSFTSETTVRIKNLSYQVNLSPSSEDYPTVMGALKKPVAMCQNRNRPAKVIKVLDSVSATLEPGKVYLLVGPPRSGKSSLLKAIAGRIKPGKRGESVTGDVTYNGDTMASGKFCPTSVVQLVDQIDDHEPFLTTKETLEFAGTCMTSVDETILDTPMWREVVKSLPVPPGLQERLMHKQGLNDFMVRQAVSSLKASVVLQLLGLKRCADTIVGNEKVRGISGGERKRVTLGEMLMGTCSVFCLDEISTGLDSAATFDVVFMIRAAARAFKRTVIISLLQPPPEVVLLFDEMLLMREGSLIYQGTPGDAITHFEGLGYKFPADSDAADFLLGVASTDNHKYLMSEGELQELALPPPPTTTAEFVEKYQRTTNFEQKKSLIETKVTTQHKWMSIETQVYKATWISSFLICLIREMKFLMRDRGYMVARLVQNLILGFVIGTIYWMVPDSDAMTRFGSTYAVLMVLAVKNVASIPIQYAHRSVFYKQRNARFFQNSAFALASILAQCVYVLIDTLTFCPIVYWCSGFSASSYGWHFLVFLASVFIAGMAMAQFFRMLCYVLSNQKSALAASGLIMLFLMLFSGFIVARNAVPPYWIWVVFLNPMFYIFQGLCSNQFWAAEFTNLTKGGLTQGQVYLHSRGLFGGQEWWYIGLIANVVLTVAYFAITVVAMNLNHIKPVAAPKDEQDKAKETTQSEMMKRTKSSVLFTPMTLGVERLFYTVTLKNGDKKDLLKGIDAYFAPGTMTALMGSSGAGKTTLLDVLAGRKTIGTIKGKVYVNGHSVPPAVYKRLIGYVEQQDLHSPFTTVLEALRFSARLRLSAKKTDQEVELCVQDVLTLLELTNQKDDLVGFPGEGLSTEQRKRLTIGVELVANPSLIFLDEPTSGLDARAAMIVVGAMKRLTDTGRTIICTIHQPSKALFENFDQLLLLKRGGETVYFGELGHNSSKLINYLEALPGTPPFTEGENPAGWMLECIGAGTSGTEKCDYAQEYSRSSLCREITEELADEMKPKQGSSALRAPERPSWFLAFKCCMARTVRSYLRQPEYCLARPFLCLVLALVVASIYAPQQNTTASTFVGFMAIFFLTTNFIGAVHCTPVIDVFTVEKASFYRERFTDMYPVSAYSLSYALAEIPGTCMTTLCLGVPFYFLCGFRPEPIPFLIYIGFLFMSNFWNVCFGQFLSAFAGSAQVAQLMNSSMSSLLSTFAGFTIRPPMIPKPWKFLYWLLPSHYYLEAMLTSQFSEAKGTIKYLWPVTGTVIDAPKTAFFNGFFGNQFLSLHLFEDALVMAGSILALSLCFWAALRFKQGVQR